MGLDMYLYRRGAEQEEELVYWRKANAVHRWFDDNFGPIDNCADVHVTRADLVRLRDACFKALNAEPERIMPTTAGFFFGSTEYDENYRHRLRNTIRRLDDLFEKHPEMTEFTYVAWW